MPSDTRAESALRAVEPSLDAFRSAVARAVDEVRAELESRRQPAGAERRTAELGPLAKGRIDPERFASVFATTDVLDPDAAERMQEALEVLSEVDAAPDRAFLAELEPGSFLRDGVAVALARLGRAFGAARTVELARAGRFRAADHESYLETFPPAMWNRAERELAPALVVRLGGADLQAAGLAEFLDGAQKLVLVVEGDAPPAPLAALITPGVTVLQTEEPDRLAALADADGPAVAALFPQGSGAARFLHDASAEGGLAGRLTVEALPDGERLHPVGSITAFRQAEDLAQVAAMAGVPATAGGAEAATAARRNGSGGKEEEEAEDDQPADRLAAWLLRQANLRDLE